MNIIGVILASGAGSRLQPLSTEEMPKQFLHLLDEEENMLQLTENRLYQITDNQMIVTLKKYEKFTHFLNSEVLFEPQRMETGFSVLYALLNIQREIGDCYIIQSPSDHHIKNEAAFWDAIHQGLQIAKLLDRIVLLGELPTRNESDYGHFLVKNDGISVEAFIEKPANAEAYVKEGALWNTAIYIYRLSTLLQEFKQHKKDEFDLLSASIDEGLDQIAMTYNGLIPFSFEREILTRSNNLAYVKSNMGWDDIGTIERLKKARGEE